MDQPKVVQKSWRDRSNTVGVIPGRSEDQANSLRRIVDQLPLDSNQNVELIFNGGDARTVRCDDFFTRQLTRGNIVIRTAEGQWDASPATRYWHETNDDIFFAKHLHANVKFFGELLVHIEKRADDYPFLELAQKFNLAWTSLDQIRRRINWMQALGLVERWSHSKLVVTDKGRQLLGLIELVTPESVSYDSTSSNEAESSDLPEPQPFLVESLSQCTELDLSSRKTIIGYIPKGRKGVGRPSANDQLSVFDALRSFLDLIGPGASSDEIFSKAEIAFGQKKSSFTQGMNTLRNMGAVEVISLNRFGVPKNISVMLEPGNEVDFVRYLHLRYQFVGELLAAMDGISSASNLVNAAKRRYSLQQIDSAEVRTRLSFLTEAGLIERIDWSRYRITANGKALVSELPLDTRPNSSEAPDEPESNSLEQTGLPRAEDTVARLAAELHRTGNASDLSLQFEQAVAEAFEFLGFRAEHLGGKGKTDVLLTVELASTERYRVIIDAKASASGVITDNAVAFDAINDHMRKHKANHAVIVGPEFSPRVKEWAGNHRTTLVTIEEVVGLMESHQVAPLTLPQLRVLFENPGDLTPTFEAYGNANATVEVLTRIVEALYQEANDDDPMAAGYISVENLQFVLRKELTPRPTKGLIVECLNFLSSAIVGALHKDGDKYKIVDVPLNIERRLHSLGSKLGTVTLENEGRD